MRLMPRANILSEFVSSLLMLMLSSLTAIASAAGLKGACTASKQNHGCSAFCGYEATKAGADFVCLPTSIRVPFPFETTEKDAAELCEIVAANHGCCDTCGFKWNGNECQQIEAMKHVMESNLRSSSTDPIIGGQGKFRYQYMPDLLKPPSGATLVNCHGLAVDADKNIILTYQNDGKTDKHCLIKWNPDGTGGEFAAKDSPELCSGTPHGLKITTENGKQYLYHANNNQKLAKTTLDGEVVWIVEGTFGQNETCGPETCPQQSCKCPGGKAPYIPTWFATPPNSKYAYLCDGYGSDRVFAFNPETGEYMNKSWGGRSPAGLHPGAAAQSQPHGKFMENHGCTYDPRNTTSPNTIVVSDRRNMRFEFFHYDPDSFDTFEYYKTVDMSGPLGPGTLPCNMRMYPEQDGRAIVPDLNGPVAVLNNQHEVISIVNVSVLLAAEQHKHPHDAILLPNGDMVVATWAPGRISYWKWLQAEE